MKARAVSRKDDNQDAIVAYLRSRHVSVDIIHMVPGALDLILGFMGIDGRAEVKDPRKPPSRRRLTEEEKAKFNTWRGRQPVVLETEQDCDEWISETMAIAMALRSRR